MKQGKEVINRKPVLLFRLIITATPITELPPAVDYAIRVVFGKAIAE